jgi:hypothetical protein
MHWLPRHAGLVTDLTFHVPTDNEADVHVGGSYDVLESALQQCVPCAAQHTQADAAAPTETAAASVAGHHNSSGTITPTRGMTSGADTTSDVLQDGVSLPLHLKSFTTNGLPSPAVLKHLQSTGVQCLKFELYPLQVPANLCPALANLQSLDNLTVWHKDTPEIDYMPVEVAAAVGQLQHLTCLSIDRVTPAGTKLLSTSLKELYLCCPMNDTCGSNDDIISLTHLTALTGLKWHSCLSGVCDVTLPQQPLQLWSSGELHLVGSQHLTSVDILTDDGDGLELLQDLHDMSSYANTTSLSVILDHARSVPWDLRNVLCRTLGGFTSLREFTFKAEGQIYKLHTWGHPNIIDQLRKLPLLTKVDLACLDDCFEGCDIVDLPKLSAPHPTEPHQPGCGRLGGCWAGRHCCCGHFQ